MIIINQLGISEKNKKRERIIQGVIFCLHICVTFVFIYVRLDGRKNTTNERATRVMRDNDQFIWW